MNIIINYSQVSEMSFFQTFKLTVFNVNLDIIIFIIFRESTKLITDATVYTTVGTNLSGLIYL